MNKKFCFKAKDIYGNLQFKVVTSRDGQTCHSKKVMEPKDFSWRTSIASRVIEVWCSGFNF
jgi:hypothetical protein